MRYAVNRLQREQRDAAYRAYLTDALKMTAENTARFAGGQYPVWRYAEILEPGPAETRTGEEIARDVIERLTGG